ncbi:Methanethiol oxidase, variant 2 [Chamberlinius hualienensis]
MKAPREELCYLPCIRAFPADKNRPDYLATVDLNPRSPTYCQVLHRLYMPYVGDELHHMGWNACSSCYGDPRRKRDRLVLPCLFTDRVYVIDIGSNPREPMISRIVEPDELHQLDVGAPHTVHCIPSGGVLISIMGDKEGRGKGALLELDADFQVQGLWSEKSANMGYDFWYQPRQNVLVSSEWGWPEAFRQGFTLEDVVQGKYGQRLHVWKWKEKEWIQTIDMGTDGMVPLEVRFLHDPDSCEGFVCCALSSTIVRIFKKADNSWAYEKIISIPPKKVLNWAMADMPGLITDIVLSMDDRYLYLNNWIHGDMRQYDIRDTSHPKLVGQVFCGGSICSDGPVKVIEDTELKEQPKPTYLKGKRMEGGPQMMQLSLDGKRLYCTTSLFSVWDRQFYPNMCRKGSWMIQVDVDTEHGGLKLNEDFLVDFGEEPEGPVLAHEIRYPGGDCTSDIFP